eukprot:SAG11_NODE_1105_length_5858_cov_3.050009_9_plen_50_part_00
MAACAARELEVRKPFPPPPPSPTLPAAAAAACALGRGIDSILGTVVWNQ